MWKSFGELFYKNKKEEKIVSWQSVILTNDSPRINVPNMKNIQLWDHQKAMLFRCKYIEEHPSYAQTKTLFEERYLNKENIKKKSQVPIGILNDPPGSGKTFVILSLILLDPTNTFNVIVVPKNLITQWTESLEKIFPKNSNISWTMCNSYSTVSSLYTDPKAFSNYRILLIDEMFVDSFALAYTGKADRVIIDEVDNIEGMMTQHIKCDKLWFMSASFSSYDSDKYKLPYEIDNNIISNIICRCDPKFIQESLKLPDPVTELIICDDADIELFKNVIPKNIIKSMHACNKFSLKKYIEYHDINDISNILLAKWYEKNLENKIAKFEELLLELEFSISKELYESEKKIALVSNYNDIQKKNNDTKKQLYNLSNNILNYKAPNETDTKNYKLANDILKRLKKNNNKWLIFNDDIEALFNLESFLNENKISNIMLDGGTVEKVSAALKKYKENTQVCLINSAEEGCGLNLENTDIIMFMQATKTNLVEQLIGRAQRFGRKNKLNIICLFDKMEVIEINKNS